MDPAELARDVVREALKDDLALFVALQYLGIVDGSQIRKQFALDLIEPTQEPVVDAPRRVYPEDRPRPIPTRVTAMKGSPFAVNPDGTVSYQGKRQSEARTLFSQWMENEIPWDPSVFGWDEDNPLSESFRGQ